MPHGIVGVLGRGGSLPKFEQQGGKSLVTLRPERLDKVGRSHHVVLPNGKGMNVEGDQKLTTILTLSHEFATGLEYPYPDVFDFAPGIGRVCPGESGRKSVIIMLCILVVARGKRECGQSQK